MGIQDRDFIEKQAGYLGLIGVYLGGFAFFAARGRRTVDLRPLDLALLGLSTFRLGRLTAFDRVTRPLREPFTETVPDQSGAGETVVPEGRGIRRTLGELIACPICVGTWIAAGLVYGLQLAPRPTRLFITITGATGLAELLNAATEALAWSGRVARKEAGSSK